MSAAERRLSAAERRLSAAERRLSAAERRLSAAERDNSAAMPREDLDRYRSRRDFSRTAEPAGGDAAESVDQSRFVVQEHHATRLHWDLRLERDGVLASWAIPNGIPAVPAENRLAVHTEDHPLEYIDFQGEIPKGEYGAGTMAIWDQGTYETHEWNQRKVEVTFHGERLNGRYGLFPIGGQSARRRTG